MARDISSDIFNVARARTKLIFRLPLSLGLAAASPMAIKSPAAKAATPPGLCLAILTDVSGSVTGEKSESDEPGEYRLMTDGTARALTSPKVSKAIIDSGGAMMFYMEFGSFPQITVPPAELRSSGDIDGFAARIAALHRPVSNGIGGRTGIGNAVMLAIQTLQERCPADVPMTIDVAGDGKNNIGISSIDARAAASRASVTINGLPILNTGPYGEPDIVQRYKDEVVNGFVIEATTGFQNFEDAMRKKLVLEISMRSVPTVPAGAGLAVVRPAAIPARTITVAVKRRRLSHDATAG